MTQKSITTTLKVVFLCLFLYLLQKQLFTTASKEGFKEAYQAFIANPPILSIIVFFFLVVINYWCEVKKLQISISNQYLLDTKTSYFAVLAGVTTGLFTPARLGEYIGRTIIIPTNKKIDMIQATFINGLAQNLMNIAFGVCFSYFSLKKIFIDTFENPILFILVAVLHSIALFGLFFYFSEILRYFIEKFQKFIPAQIKDKLEHLRFYPKQILQKIMGFSFLRYLVYLVQYVIIIRALHIETEIIYIISNVTLIYMLQSLIIIPGVFSIFARGEMAILVWSTVNITSAVALLATFFLWLMNLAIPALIGLFIIFTIKNRD